MCRIFKQRDNQIKRKHQKRKVVTALKQEEKPAPITSAVQKSEVRNIIRTRVFSLFFQKDRLRARARRLKNTQALH